MLLSDFWQGRHILFYNKKIGNSEKNILGNSLVPTQASYRGSKRRPRGVHLWFVEL